MTKKKKPTIKITAEPVEQIDPTREEVSSVQLDKALIEEKTEHAPTEPETALEAEPEKSVHAETAPAEETVSKEPPSVPVLGPKPKSLNMAYLQEEIDCLTYQIGELLKNPVRQRKAVESSRKVQMLDKVSGKIYPSKNNLYLSLLKSGELKELVDKGIFGSNPEKNTFGVYSLLRVWNTRFQPVQSRETNIK